MANIRTACRSGLVLRGGRNIRSTIWGGLAEVETTIVGPNGAALVNVTGAGLLALRPFTAVRFRGYWHLRSDQTGAAEDFQAAWSSCVVSDQAVAIGITAVPTGFTDKDSDLFYMYDVLAGAFVFVSGTGFQPIGGLTKDVDSKAMRKVEEGSQLIWTLEASGLSNGITAFTSGRVLLKLH